MIFSGEDGQSGGDGGAGWSSTVEGKDGTDPKFEEGWLKNNSSVVISFGTRGNDSGRGGHAGMGGASGKSGVSGKIEILDLNNELNCPTSQEQAEDGKPGQPGNPGKGGKHTTHGTDRGKYGTTLKFFSKIRTMATHTRPQKTITNAEGELCHDEISYDRSIPHPTVETYNYEKPANNKEISQTKNKDHPDFVDRGCNRDGETAKVKVNSSLANENKAVDKQACFQALREQCRQSFQHWNCESHNRFLGAFAKKIGELHHSDLIGTRSGAIRSNHVMWISQLHSISESTEVSITYKAEEQTQAHHLKDYEKEQKSSSVDTDSILDSKSAETQPLSVDVSSLKQRAEQKKFPLKNYLIESLLNSNGHDDEIENLQATLNLSEESIHFVRCNTADLATEHQSRFLIMQDLKTKAWIFRDPGGTTHNMTVTSSLEVLTMEDNLISPLNRDTTMYEEIVSWICGVVGEVTEIPATTEQVLCLKKLKLIILIKKSYDIVGKKCDSEEMISLINKLFGICLDRLIKSNFKCSVTNIGFEIVDFLKVLRQFSFAVTRPDLQALIHILDHILKITSETNSVLLQDPSVLLQDPSMLLISVTKVLESMYLYYNNLFHISSTGENHNTEVEHRNQLIKGHVKSIAEFHATFLAYPMSCPLVALMRWKECIECEIIPKLEQKVKLLKTSSDNNVLENLGALKRKIQNLSNFLSKVIKLQEQF